MCSVPSFTSALRVGAAAAGVATTARTARTSALVVMDARSVPRTPASIVSRVISLLRPCHPLRVGASLRPRSGCRGDRHTQMPLERICQGSARPSTATPQAGGRRSRRRRAMRPPSLGRFERAQERAEQSFELPDLVGIEPLQQFAVILRQAATAASTTSRPSSVNSTITPRRSSGSRSRRTRPRRSSRSIRLVTPADESIRPLPSRVGESRNRGPSDPQGTQGAHFATAKPELVENSFLALRQQRPDAAQACGHLQCIDVELGPRRDPAADDAIGQVMRHAGHDTRDNLDASILLVRELPAHKKYLR